MRIAASLHDLDLLLGEQRKEFVLEKVGLSEASGWGVERGILRHETGGFFSVAGASIGPGEDRLFLYQPQSAVTGLLAAHMEGQWHVLVQARAEPGTYGTAQYAPTIQSTLANYLGLHGGRPAPYTDHFIRHHPSVRRFIHDSEQLDLGERYLYKTKRVAIAECDPDIDVAGGFIWMSAAQVQESVGRSYFLNTDLRAALGVFPWAAEPGREGALVPACELVRLGLARPVRPELIGAVCARLGGKASPCVFKPLDELDNWDIRQDGFFERRNFQGFAIEFFYCEAPGREVHSWFQPLLNSRGTGYAALHCRKAGFGLEVLVRAGDERGLKTGQALLPTVLKYPDSTGATGLAPGKVLASTMESDEGGRFLHDTSRYELVLVAPEHEPVEGESWMSISELKWFLAHSNLCSIQLRGIASMLLGELPC